ncbi:TPA: hypothetical protein AB5D93_002902 [Vibrio cholerae]
MKATGKEREEFQLLVASVWSKRNDGNLDGIYHEKLAEIMSFIISGGDLKDYQIDFRPCDVFLKAAECLSEIGQSDLAIALVESAAYLESSSISGPFGHRLDFHRNRGRKEYPFWNEIIDIAKSIKATHLKRHPNRPLKDLQLARQALDVFLNDFVKPNNICDKSLPKSGTVAQKIKELDINTHN